MWSVLFLTLPTQPTAVRVRVWRALKSLGSPMLRDGAYLLPQSVQHLFQPIVQEVLDAGGSAQVMVLTPSDDMQRNAILSLFDRSEAYATWRRSLDAWLNALPQAGETDARRQWRALEQMLQDIRAADHYPGEAALQAASALAHARTALEARHSRGEPQAQADHGIERLDARRFQGKRWATRARPWVDRLASAWLIRRFIDPQARFVWLQDPARAPRGVIGFDYDGARFTHVGSRVTFEVLQTSFGLDHVPPLNRMAATVHYLDAGGIPTPEAQGLEALLAGLRELHAHDDALLDAACALFDAFHADPGHSPARS